MSITFSKRTEDVILHARNEAIRLKSPEIDLAHFFLGIVKIHGQTRDILHDFKINVDDLIWLITANLKERQRDKQSKEPGLSKSAEKILKIVPLEAKLLSEDTIEPYHLLLSILRETGNPVTQELERQHLAEGIRDEIEMRVKSGRLKSERGFLSNWFGI